MADYSSEDASGDDLYARLKSWFADDDAKFKLWWNGVDENDGGAREDFKFRDGDQWREDEKQTLIENDRPVLVFNRTGVLVDAVVGSEIGNRREVRYIPRGMEDAKPNEVLTSAAEWFRDQCDAEDEESEAFKDTVTGGMGWTETRIDYEENPQGDPKIEHFSPDQARWDCHAEKANLVDTNRRWRLKKMPIENARQMFPGVADEDLNAAWADSGDDDENPRRIEPGNRYNGDDQGEGVSDTVTIVGCQYLKKEAYYKAAILGPDGQPQIVELDQEKHDIAQKAGAVLKSVRMTRKKVYVCWLGAKVLKEPKPTQTGTWTWQCITGLKDQTNGIFYGIVRRAKDPQRWANKWLSQMMHILNSQAKGGIMAEKGAFDNQRDAEESWAKAERITWLSKGGLTSANGAKVQAKPVAQFPAGFDRLLQYADEAIIKATGINMELLGMRDAQQAGILEYQRKQSGLSILASFFDSLKRYRKLQGRGMLHLIKNFLSDGRMVRIVGDEKAQWVPLTKGMFSEEYDVIVDDSPTSPNEKEKTWQILQGILPGVKEMVTPQVMLTLLDYSPLPTSLVEKLKQVGQQQAQAAQNPQANPAMMLEQAKLANESKALDLQMMEQQIKSKELDVKLAELQQKQNSDYLTSQTERGRQSVDTLEAYAHLAEATRPPDPQKMN
jgi:hypothetical protein